MFGGETSFPDDEEQRVGYLFLSASTDQSVQMLGLESSESRELHGFEHVIVKSKISAQS